MDDKKTMEKLNFKSQADECGSDASVFMENIPNSSSEYSIQMLKQNLKSRRSSDPPHELQVMKRYSDLLINKLEEKNIELEETIASLTIAREKEQDVHRQLLQAQKMETIGTLAGGIAHDFNNILTVINGYSELHVKTLECSHPLRADMVEILKAGKRASALVGQLLAFSRRQIVEAKVINLKLMIIELEAMLVKLIPENIEFVTMLNSSWAVKLDPGQLQQVFANLVVNATHAMPQGGKLCIETKNIVVNENDLFCHGEILPGEYVLIDISDTGTGMSDEVKSHLFEPFFTTKEPGKGTGLGLATTYGIVKESKGSIEVKSEIGAGTHFKIYLPRVNEAMSVGEVCVIEDESNPRGTETILLVEDEKSVRKFTSLILKGQGYNVLEAADGEEALRLVQKMNPEVHVLITDMIMPKMGGKAVAHEIKMLFPELSVIFVSGYTEDSSIFAEDIKSKTGFLQKPFSPKALANKIREVLDGSKV